HPCRNAGRKVRFRPDRRPRWSGRAMPASNLNSRRPAINSGQKETQWRKRDEAMKVRLGELLAECPYCGSTDFAGGDDANEARELRCARCDGYASRKVVLETLADKAGELGRLTLARLSEERRRKDK